MDKNAVLKSRRVAVLRPDQAVVKLDWDDCPGHQQAKWETEVVHRATRAGYRITRWESSTSPGGKGVHVLLWVEPVPATAMEVVALQLLFLSDPYREALQIERAHGAMLPETPDWMRDRWNVLYGPSRVRGRRARGGV